MPRPNFFIVGAAKGGTTSMYRYLLDHPQIFMPSVKECYYFGDDLGIADFRRIRGEQNYLNLFAAADPSMRIGEATPWYLYSETAAAEIKAFSPEAKIIIMLRNPVEAIRSLHWTFVSSTNEDIVDFAEALAAEADRLEGRSIPPQSHFPKGLCYRQAVDYPHQIERFLDVFGPANVHFILHDDFRADTARVYRDALKYLEVDSDHRLDFQVYNEGRDLKNLAVTRFLKDKPRLLKALERLPDGWLRRGNQLAATMLGTGVERDGSFDPALRRKLTEEFKPRIRALEELLQRDLSAWLKEA